jgi:hypothetical protein
MVLCLYLEGGREVQSVPSTQQPLDRGVCAPYTVYRGPLSSPYRQGKVQIAPDSGAHARILQDEPCSRAVASCPIAPSQGSPLQQRQELSPTAAAKPALPATLIFGNRCFMSSNAFQYQPTPLTCEAITGGNDSQKSLNITTFMPQTLGTARRA